jgi:hypothetical protein
MTKDSSSGYDSDRSSMNGSAIDGEFDEEDTSSLTKQLAETAQGVREMSKELGTSRRRDVWLIRRSHKGTITYPTCFDCHQSKG